MGCAYFIVLVIKLIQLFVSYFHAYFRPKLQQILELVTVAVVCRNQDVYLVFLGTDCEWWHSVQGDRYLAAISCHVGDNNINCCS